MAEAAGIALLRRGDAVNAEKLLRSSLAVKTRSYPKDNAELHLARALKAQERRDEARRILRRLSVSAMRDIRLAAMQELESL